ncbi:aldehyde ferredoxin oxidoreductase family protein [Caldivirga sp.]|uniref:aldehyde ferredoxin oxidoreductase family protein n=1 Tax=Caldivirga sp. TaxID=2080243 RepID=UPI003D1011E2
MNKNNEITYMRLIQREIPNTPTYGYVGKILKINLSGENTQIEDIPQDVVLKWLGGRGLGVYFFLKEVNPEVSPLSEGNKVILATGPLTGINGSPTPGRITIVSKSPLNGRLTYSSVGGQFGPTLKLAGFDVLIIEGKLSKPSYLILKDKRVYFKDASSIWGKDVTEAYDKILSTLHEEYGVSENNASIALIGPAGENLVKYASIMFDKHHAAGRMGFGAVLGYKRVKAIVVVSSKNMEIKVYDKDLFRINAINVIRRMKNNPIIRDLTSLGTLGALATRVSKFNAIPAFNLTKHVDLNIDQLVKEWKERIDQKESRREYCYGCQICCHKHVKSKSSEYRIEGSSPEYYGGLVSLGTYIGVTDLDFIIYAKNLCDKMGLDAISTGQTIATLIELVADGRINYGIKYGDKDTIIKLIKMIAHREGIGDELAEGAQYLADKYGEPVTAVTNKRLEVSLCNLNAAMGYKLALATSNRGDVNQVYLKHEVLSENAQLLNGDDAVDYAIHIQNLMAILDSCVICAFSGYVINLSDLSKLLIAVTGMDFNESRLAEIGERIYTAERYYNALTLGKESDELPSRLGSVPAELLNRYYERRGWVNGIPSVETLKKLKVIE